MDCSVGIWKIRMLKKMQTMDVWLIKFLREVKAITQGCLYDVFELRLCTVETMFTRAISATKVGLKNQL